MRHRVKILSPPDPKVTDAMGQPSGQPTEVAERWAEVRDLTGRRMFAAHQTHAELSVEVTMHYTDLVKPGYFIKHGDRLLEIVGIPADPTGMRREIVCTCREVQ